MDRLRSNRGAVLVHVTLALLSFTAVSALVIDYGIQLVSRHQIQTAADAAALAGATALAFDSYADRSDTGPAKTAALAMATENKVWQQAANVTAGDISFPVCADSFDAGPSATPILACVKVDAFRNQDRGNPLPSFFGQLFGVTSSSVSASATAEAKDANATDCLKPLAVPDRWIERNPVSGPWTSGSTFDKWDPANPAVLLSPPDSYTAPTGLSSGSGLKITVDFGVQVVLSQGATATPVSHIKPWNYLTVQIPDSAFGGDVAANITGCAKSSIGVGDRLNLVAGNAGVVATALRDLFNRDPGAHWNTETNHVDGSCADAPARCASMSPRIIALPVYHPGDLADNSRAGATSIKVSNIVGFFIESVDVVNATATGRVTRHPGLIRPTATTLIDASSFLRASLLVQ